MSIRAPGQPGPRLSPIGGGNAPRSQAPDDGPSTMGHDGVLFSVIGCHSSRDGFAAITLQEAGSGALVRIQRVPFEHHYGEDFDSQCRRIQAAARAIVQNLAEAMAATSKQVDA